MDWLYQAQTVRQNHARLMYWLHQAQTARQNHARRSQMKKLLVLSGFLEQKFAGNLYQNFTLFTKRDRIWCCLAQSGQLPSIFLPIFGPGNQIEPAIFCLAPSGMILSGCLGLGVARALGLPYSRPIIPHHKGTLASEQ